MVLKVEEICGRLEDWLVCIKSYAAGAVQASTLYINLTLVNILHHTLLSRVCLSWLGRNYLSWLVATPAGWFTVAVCVFLFLFRFWSSQTWWRSNRRLFVVLGWLLDSWYVNMYGFSLQPPFPGSTWPPIAAPWFRIESACLHLLQEMGVLRTL